MFRLRVGLGGAVNGAYEVVLACGEGHVVLAGELPIVPTDRRGAVSARDGRLR